MLQPKLLKSVNAIHQIHKLSKHNLFTYTQRLRYINSYYGQALKTLCIHLVHTQAVSQSTYFHQNVSTFSHELASSSY